MTKKKKVVVVGNCQARPIAALLDEMSDEIEVTQIAIVHLLQSEQEAEYKPFFEEADIIIAQLVAPSYPCEFVRTDWLEKFYSHKLVKIVNLFCYSDTPYLRNIPQKLRGQNSPFGDYHFPIAYECWEKGEDINNTVLALNKQFNHIRDVESYDELATREQQADVSIVDYIKKSKKRLFHTFNHPCNDLLLEYSKRILNYLNIKIKPLTNKPVGALLGQFIPFIENDGEYQHKITKNTKVMFKTSLELVSEFYDFYQNNQENKEEVNNIPKVIVQYWDGDLPDEIKKLTDTWKENNPECEYKLFNHEQALQFIKKNYGLKEVNFFLKAKLPAMQSDIFRVAYCLSKGGLYVDAATSCNKSLSALFSRHTLQVMRKWHGGLWNGLILTPPNNPILKKIWQKIIYNLDHETSNDVWAATGPGLFNEFCKEDENLNVIAQSDCNIYFSLINDLNHKKNNHWSKVQEKGSIFLPSIDNSFEPKIIIDLGPHKKEGVTFQGILEKNENLLKKGNIALVTVRSSLCDSYKELRNDYTRILQGVLLSDNVKEQVVTDKLASILVRIVEIVKKQQPDTKKVLISDGNLLGPLVGHYFANKMGREINFYSLHKLIFDSFKVAFSSKLEKVIVGDTGCESFILSSYADFVSKSTDAKNLKCFMDDLSDSIYAQYDDFFYNAELIFADKLKRLSFDFFCEEMVNLIDEMLNIHINNSQSSKVGSNTISNHTKIEITLKAYIDNLPNDVSQFMLQDLNRWIEVCKYEEDDPFEHFYLTRQEFRSLILYRARIAQKKFQQKDIIKNIFKVHANSNNTWVTNLFISCDDIGPGFYIEHGFSTIIYAKSIGENFYVNQSVTIGTGKGGNPTIGNNVRVGANSVIIGDIYVADNVKVGAGAVLNFEVSANSIVVSQKARVL